MDRATLLKMWDEFWNDGLWFAPWSKSLDGLTATQAAWRPQPDRHSIWQLVSHVCFWREDTLRMIAGEPRFGPEERARLNFPEPGEISEAQWAATRERLAESHRRMRAAIADDSRPLERPLYHLPHDSNHLGQILYLRGMLGLPPLE